MAQYPKLIQAIPLMFVALWSTGFIAAKYALPFIEPFYLLFIRMLITTGVFFLLVQLVRAKWPNTRQTIHQMVVGGLVHTAYLGGVFAAIKWGMPAGIAAIIVGIQPLLTALIAWRWLGGQLQAQQWLGLVMGLTGVIIIIFSTQNIQSSSSSFDEPAFPAALLALAGISIGTLYQKRFGSGVDLVAGSFWQYSITVVIMGLLAWSTENRVVVWDIQLILALFWMVFGLSVGAVLLLMYMIREGEAAKVASYFYLVPAAVSVEAWILLNETLPWIAVLAIGITVLGVFLVVRR